MLVRALALLLVLAAPSWALQETAPRGRLPLARKLLAEAGFPGGKDFPRLELLYNTSESHKKIASAVQQMWKQSLGIDVELRNTEWKVYLDHLTKVDYHIARRGWVADYPDPNTFLDMFMSKSGNNNTKWSHAGYDRLIADSGRERDPAARLRLLEQAEQILMDEMPVVPVYFYVTQSMWRPETKGLFDNAMNVHPLKEVVHGDGTAPFVMNVGAEPQTLDPNVQRGVTEHRVNIALFEGLTTYDPRTLEARPGIAESWTTSEDGTKWTFKLREARWSDGKPVTAGDFVYGWRRQIDPNLASDYAYIVYSYLKNAKAWYDGATADATLAGLASLDAEKRLEAARELPASVQARHAAALKERLKAENTDEIRKLLEAAAQAAPQRKDVSAEEIGVRAADDRTLVVELEASTPYFLYLTSFFTYFPIPQRAVQQHGDKWIRPGNIVTNGPFLLKEWVPNSHIVVERNGGYWDAARVKQRLIRFLPIDNISTGFNMYKAKQCDYIDTVPLEFVDVLRKEPDFHSVPYLTTYFYSFNVTQKPLDDKRVRRALALAIDRDRIVEKILQGGQSPAYSMVPPSLAGYQPRPFWTKPQ